MTGNTDAWDFPTTLGAYQTSKKGVYYIDAFVSRLSSDLNTPCIYVSGWKCPDDGISVAIDAGGNVYLAGNTASSDFPTTLGAYQTNFKRSYVCLYIKAQRRFNTAPRIHASGGTWASWSHSIAIDTRGMSM